MTPFIAATATPEQGTPWWVPLIPVAVALLAAAVYAGSCAWRPFAGCLCCKGSGKHARKDGRVWRRCRWCKGSGTRLRVGRRVWNRFAAVRKAAD